MKNEISIPKPHRLQDGRYTAQLMIDGKRTYIYGNTLAEYRMNIITAKTTKNIQESIKLCDLINQYIESNEGKLSPSTLKGYQSMSKARFKNYMDKNIYSINFQKMINDESLLCSGKTVNNAWSLVSSALKSIKFNIPDIVLPNKELTDMPFLDFEQIKIFLNVVRGTSVECASILALHSLRMSELLALDVSDIGNSINVNKAIVLGIGNIKYLKSTKTKFSVREVPILIPRLLEVLPVSGKAVTMSVSSIEKNINRICRDNNLPEVACHGLRRSFASLAYHLDWNERTTMLIGGWSNMQTVHKHYIKLARKDVDDDVKKMQDYFKIT